MINGFWGTKIGMTQVFSDDHKVVPVTVIDLARWLVTQVKTVEKDGYSAVQLGCVKKRFETDEFSSEWMQEPEKYFSTRKEVRLEEDAKDLHIGTSINIDEVIATEIEDGDKEKRTAIAIALRKAADQLDANNE